MHPNPQEAQYKRTYTLLKELVESSKSDYLNQIRLGTKRHIFA